MQLERVHMAFWRHKDPSELQSDFQDSQSYIDPVSKRKKKEITKRTSQHINKMLYTVLH